MSIKNGIIEKPISFSEIADTIGTSVDMARSENIKADSLFRPYEIGKPFPTNFKTGGDDGLYGYNVPMTSNNNVHDLWKKTWSDKGRPKTWCPVSMFDGYFHKADHNTYPFGIKLTEAGSAWVIEYICYNDVAGVVNPGLMEKLKTFYPAFQLFEEDTAATGPKTTACFNWCGEKPVGEGGSGEYLYDLGIVEGKTYYGIPFLSQYKFTTTKGDMGILNGEKYCLIYKDFSEDEWTFGYVRPESLYNILTWGEFTKDSSYTCTVRYSLASKQKTWRCYVYGGIRVYTKVNGVEAVWFENWNSYDYKRPTSGYYTVTPNEAPIEDSITFSWNGQALPSTANRIEIRLFDPTNNYVSWTKSFDL